ncbi:hypothetical protein LguiA_010832 [Lonicera macranthoides]
MNHSVSIEVRETVGGNEVGKVGILRAVPTTAGCDSKSRTRMNTTQKSQDQAP